MAKFNQLRDLYTVPGFVADAHIHGVFGDPYAVVIPLRRLRKKRSAGSAAPAIAPSTINRRVGSATWTVAADASTSSSPSAASPAGVVRP